MALKQLAKNKGAKPPLCFLPVPEQKAQNFVIRRVRACPGEKGSAKTARKQAAMRKKGRGNTREDGQQDYGEFFLKTAGF